MSELSPEARDLLDRHAGADDPRAEDRQRMRARLAMELGAAALATSGAVATSSAVSASGASGNAAGLVGAAKSGFWTAVSKAALAFGLVGAVGAGVMMSRQTPSESAPHAALRAAVQEEPQAAPVSAPVEAPAPIATAMDAQENGPLTSQNRESGRRKAKPTRVAEDNTLGAELALLSQAQQALHTGSPAQALQLTHEHATRFPSGALRHERIGVEALARCALGQDRAQVWADFLRTAPDSPLRARVRAACGEP